MNVDTGEWHCFRCERSGLLDERKTPRDVRSPHGEPVGTAREPSRAELAERTRKLARLRRLWQGATAIEDPTAAVGAHYRGHAGSPLDRRRGAVRFARNWYGWPAVVFLVQNAGGRLVAAEGRYVDRRSNPKGQTPAQRAAAFLSLRLAPWTPNA